LTTVRSSWQSEMKIRAGREKFPTNVFMPFASTSVMMLNLRKYSTRMYLFATLYIYILPLGAFKIPGIKVFKKCINYIINKNHTKLSSLFLKSLLKHFPNLFDNILFICFSIIKQSHTHSVRNKCSSNQHLNYN